MAATKAELAGDRSAYYAHLDEARRALEHRDFAACLAAANATLAHVNGMMQYERRFEDREFTSIEGIEFVLLWAPLLLHSESLVALEELLRRHKRIDKFVSDDLARKLENSKVLLDQCHLMWDHLESNHVMWKKEIGSMMHGDSGHLNFIEEWMQMGVIRESTEKDCCGLSLVTRMEAAVRAKCPSCGATAQAAKFRFLERIKCPNCEKTVPFVIMGNAEGAKSKG